MMNAIAKKLKDILYTGLMVVLAGQLVAAEKIEMEEGKCPGYGEPPKSNSRSSVYKNMPFKPGEEIRYELKYGAVGVHVGYGYMRVEKPIKHRIKVGAEEKKRWHRSFSVEAYTGDWYKAIFRAHDRVQAFSRPWDFGISRFYMSEDHSKTFGSSTKREKWLEFVHSTCEVQVDEKIYHKNKEKKELHALVPGAVDALGAVYKLRTMDFTVGKKIRFVVFTSGKNWWLEAEPMEKTTLETKIGKQESIRLKVATSLGEDLEQKGAVDIWIASKHPNRPLLKVSGEANFGKFALDIDQFKAGK